MIPVVGVHPDRPIRAPLVWILLPLIGGYLGQRLVPQVDAAWPLLCGIALAAASCRGPTANRWRLYFVMSVGLLAWAWAGLRSTNLPGGWESLPPREIFAEVVVEEIYDGTVYPNTRYAIARILSSELPVDTLRGERLFGSFRQDEEALPLRIGARFRVRGVIHPLDAGEGSADAFMLFLQSRHTHFRLRQGTVLEQTATPPFFQRALTGVHQQWTQWLTRAPPERTGEANLLAAMLLGDRDLIAEEQEERFLLSGTMHLFAISGLHVMMVALTLHLLAALLPIPANQRHWLVLTVLGGYILVTGASPSAVRAYAMVLFYWLGSSLSRSSSSVPAILLSAFVVLLVSPAQLFSVGFQLSYSVVLSILLLGIPLSQRLLVRFPLFQWVLPMNLRWWQRAWKMVFRWAVQSCTISLAATLGSAPLIALHFEVWTPGAIFFNALLVPVGSLVVSIGVLVILSYSIGLAVLAEFFARAAWLALFLMDHFIAQAVRIPGSHAERIWREPVLGHAVMIGFVLSLFLIHSRNGTSRIPEGFRFAIPILLVLLGIALGTKGP